MPISDADKIVRAINDNTRELKKLGGLVERSTKPVQFVQSNFGPVAQEAPKENVHSLIDEQIVIHRAKRTGVYGYLFAASCDDTVLVDQDILTVSVNEDAINCPSCKTP